MEFGMFHEFQSRPGRSEAESFAEAFTEVDAAERWGLDAMWLAELHVDPQRSVLSAPLNVATAIAGRTTRMKIGIAVQVLPLCHPLRVAEEAATVDHLSQGRLIFGVGRSGFPRTYDAYGVPYGESRERFAEVLEIIKLAWTRPTFSFSGKYHQFNNVCCVPKPLQKPYPPIRIAATSPDTFPIAGAGGYPIFAAVRLGTLDELGPEIREYREAYTAAGHPGKGQVFLRVPVYVAETEEQARTEPEASIMHFYRLLGGRSLEAAGRADSRPIEQRAARGERLQSITFDEARREKVIVGTAGQVTDRLRELQESLGIDGILAEMNCGGLIPQDRVMNSLRLMCEKVMPAFK